jgi:hypothetical protein
MWADTFEGIAMASRLLSMAMLSVLSLIAVLRTAQAATGADVHHAQGEMAGEVTASTVLLQVPFDSPLGRGGV